MKVEEKLNLLTQSVANKALQFTPIISLPNPPSAIPLGSGLFLKIKDSYFLASAGHLLNFEDWPKLTVPGNNDTLVNLNGVLITTFENGKTDSDVDFAVFKFAERQIKHLIDGHYNFIDCSDIKVNHKVEENGYYIIAGYPVNGVKKTAGKAEFKPIPAKFLTYPLKHKKHKNNNFNPNHFILVKYQRKVAPLNSSEKQITRELKGISGSGLWHIPNWKDLNNGVPKFQLVGIMTENHKNKGFLVAIRIDFITEIINQIFDLNAFENSQFEFNGSIKQIYGGEIK
ncbi:hypothetical protein [Flavobacterium sp.]|uniref:hypothetical protein n=1 Tax=Flavobacterium sp. TaxID=239 RepID=UPI003D12590B